MRNKSLFYFIILFSFSLILIACQQTSHNEVTKQAREIDDIICVFGPISPPIIDFWDLTNKDVVIIDHDIYEEEGEHFVCYTVDINEEVEEVWLYMSSGGSKIDEVTVNGTYTPARTTKNFIYAFDRLLESNDQVVIKYQPINEDSTAPYFRTNEEKS